MRRSLLLGALLTAAASFVILYDLGGPSVVNGDEAVYHDAARQMLRTGDWLRWTSEGPVSRVTEFRNSPVQYWLRIAAIRLLGDTTTAVRIVSALAGIATVLAVFAFARRRAGDAAGLVAGLVQLTTVHFVYLHGARTGELDAIVSLGSLVALAAFVRDLAAGKGFWLSHLALVALANFKAPLLVPIAASQLLVLALSGDRAALVRRWTVAASVVWPVGLAWHWLRLLVLGADAWAVLGFVADRALDSPRAASRPDLAARVVFYANAFAYGCFP